MTPPLVLTALLVTGAVAEAPAADAPDTSDPTATTQPLEVADVPATIPLPHVASCPAYVGPQCDSVAHEQWATGQDIASLAGFAA